MGERNRALAPAPFGPTDARQTISQRDIDLGLALTGELSQCSLTALDDVSLAGFALNEVDLVSSCSRLDLSKVQGFRVRLSGLSESSMADASITEMTVERLSSFDTVSMAGLRAPGSTWRDRINIVRSNLAWSVFRRSSFVGTTFVGCDLTGADLTSCSFSHSALGDPCLFDGCELDMLDVSGSDLSGASFVDCPLESRLILSDAETVFSPTLPGGCGLATRAIDKALFEELTAVHGVTEADIRAVANVLSPSFVPVYDDGSWGAKGELLTRALIMGESLAALAVVQTELWRQSRDANPALVADPAEVYL